MSGGFQAYGQAPGHYHESALAFGAPHLPLRPPELASARYQHPPAGHFNYTQTPSMTDAPFLTPEDEFAQLQKLSNEYEPEATVRRAPTAPYCPLLPTLTGACRARWSATARAAAPSRPSTRPQTPSSGSRPRLCSQSMPSSAPAAATATAAGEVSLRLHPVTLSHPLTTARSNRLWLLRSPAACRRRRQVRRRGGPPDFHEQPAQPGRLLRTCLH